ncbi:MAG: Omp28 family outer membrane lipoprotein [Muribaculaceae bacterium]|nr:Omp28 family outer membrane lipoprotein [Muribaculaceae bacterium]
MRIFSKSMYICAALAASAAISSCNEIKVEDRFIELPAVEAKRVVLLEEFTGQKCVNCPDAHAVIEGLQEQYPDNLISVSIHGGSDMNAIGEDQMPGYGLRNAAGAAYADANKISSFPAGVVNRRSGVTTSDQWSTAIRNEISKPSALEMELTASLSADGSKVNIDVDLEPWENIDGRLQLWVVESGIVSLQLTKSGMKRDYVHNHVFRGTVNGQDGESIRLVTREPQHVTASVAVPDIWNTENLAIVGFVYTSDGVVQAAHCNVEF